MYLIPPERPELASSTPPGSAPTPSPTARSPRGRVRRVVGAFIRRVRAVELLARLIFGVTVLVAAANKLTPGSAGAYVAQIPPATDGPWFAFWGGIAGPNPVLFVGVIAGFEFLLAAGLLLGVLRKVIYTLGMGLGIFLWTVPEGFSGFTYTRGLAASAGLLYLTGLLLLVALETTYGPDPLTLDYQLVRRWPRWALVSSFVGTTEPIAPPAYMVALTPFLKDLEGSEDEAAPAPGTRRRQRRW